MVEQVGKYRNISLDVQQEPGIIKLNAAVFQARYQINVINLHFYQLHFKK